MTAPSRAHTRRRVSLTALVVALTCLAAPVATATTAGAAAGNQVPFAGAFRGVETNTSFAFPIVTVRGEWTGVATHLDRFTVENPHVVNLLSMSGSGSFQFTAANGDSLTADEVGQAYTTTNPDVLRIVEHANITGGTGRFAGAIGSFNVQRLFNRVTFGTIGFFSGTISSP